MTSASRHLSSLSLAIGLVLTFSAPVFAAGSESDETSPPPKTETTTKCADGKIWDAKKKECVKPKKSSFNDRKAGRMELGMSYYRKALQADENYILARSYMGQALMEQGDIQAARVQLVEIRDRGGEKTWAYRSLLQSLNGYKTY
jgi:hypothetical protein